MKIENSEIKDLYPQYSRVDQEDLNLTINYYWLEKIKDFYDQEYQLSNIIKEYYYDELQDRIQEILNWRKERKWEREEILRFYLKKFIRSSQETLDLLYSADLKRIIELAQEHPSAKYIYCMIKEEMFTDWMSDKEKKLRDLIPNFKTMSESNKEFLLLDIVDINDFEEVYKKHWKVRYAVFHMKWKIIYDIIDWKVKEITDMHKEIFFEIWYSHSMWWFSNQLDYLLSLDFKRICEISKDTNFELPLSKVIEMLEKEELEKEKNSLVTFEEKYDFLERNWYLYYNDKRDLRVIEDIIRNNDIDKAIEIIWLAENYHKYKNELYDKEYEEFLNKESHTKKEKIDFLTKESYSSFFRLPKYLQDDLCKYEIKDFIKFKEDYKWHYELKNFLLRKKFEWINIDEKWFFLNKCWHSIFIDNRRFHYLYDNEHEIDKIEFYCEKCNWKRTESLSQKLLANEIEKLYTWKITQNNRKILEWKEIDILLEEKKIWFEYNWVYWHRDDNWKSLWKINKAKEKWYKLYVIWESFFNKEYEPTMEVIEFLVNWKNNLYKIDKELKYKEVDWVYHIKKQTYSENTKNKLKEMIDEWKHIILEHEKEFWDWEMYLELWFKKVKEIWPMKHKFYDISYHDLWKIVFEYKK